MYEFAPGSVSTSLHVLLRDASTGQPKTGLTIASPGVRAGYSRQGGTPVSFALVGLAADDSAWASGGFRELDAAIMPGTYRLDVPDAAGAAGASFYTVGVGADNVLGEGVLVLLRNPVNNVGPGAFTFTWTVQTAGLLPIAGASLWASTDAAGTNVIAGALTTGATGQVAFLLSAGTYYLWANAQGYSPVNPTAFTVSASSGQTLTLAAAAAPPSLTPGAGTHAPRVTVWDLAERLNDYVGADPDEKNFRAVRRSVLDALREFTTSHNWTYLRTYGRVALGGAYDTGTVAFDLTGGTYEKMLTLTDGTWPTWAAAGSVRVGDVVAKVDRRVSDTVLVLKSPCFLADLDALSDYTLYRDCYTLPADFVAGDNALAESSWGQLSFVPYSAWLERTRYQNTAGQPMWWTIAGDPDVPGRLAMLVYPPPDADGSLDFMYYRKPREVSCFEMTAGTVTIALGSPTLATFSSAVLKAGHQGAVLRLSSSATEVPDSLDGTNPYVHEANIVSVLSETTAQLDCAVTQDLVAVAYRISDPVDAEDLQQVAVGRAAEKQLAFSRRLKGLESANKVWVDALVLAKEADSRVVAQRTVGRGGLRRPRLADMPIDFS